MSESFSLVMSVAAAWFAIGIVLSIVMGRRGHNGFGWLVMGALMGPLGIAMAIEAGRHDEELRPRTIADRVPVIAGTGPVDVLVGYDGSSEAAAAPQAVIDLLGDRLGRLTVATVVPYGGLGEQERAATDLLRSLARRVPSRSTELEIVHGHPSVALRQSAVEGGYKLIAVGTRGAGITKALMGSAASELSRDSTIPVLLVGDPHERATETITDQRQGSPAPAPLLTAR